MMKPTTTKTTVKARLFTKTLDWGPLDLLGFGTDGVGWPTEGVRIPEV